MMNSLWTAASGMQAQQLTVDVISNNLANVNTTAFKKDRVEFKDLLYDTLDRASMLNNQGKPVNLQVGHGTTAVATVKDFTEGSPQETGNPLDFYIDGEGFFTVQGPKGDVNYTRDGSFKTTVTDQGKMLTTSDGYPVLDDTGNPIIFSSDMSSFTVAQDGTITYTDSTGATVPLGQTIGIVNFENRSGLESIGDNLYASNDATGDPVPDADSSTKSLINQNFLEASNVQTVEEMVNLIEAQRAYELNSKAIQSTDDMMSMANNLRK